jgi:hypothetical protein
MMSLIVDVVPSLRHFGIDWGCRAGLLGTVGKGERGGKRKDGTVRQI